MATLKEEFESLKIKVGLAMAKGDEAALREPVHVVFHSQEKKRKTTNPGKSTRIMLNCRTPEQWTAFHMAKERYFEVAKDPHIAIDCMIKALDAFSAGVIADWVKQGFEPGQGPPKAEIPPMEELPEWLR